MADGMGQVPMNPDPLADPQSEALLIGILVAKPSLAANGRITADLFIEPLFQAIAGKIVDRVTAGMPITLAELERDCLEFPGYQTGDLGDLVHAARSWASFADAGEHLALLAQRRKIRAALADLQARNASPNTPPGEVIGAALSELPALLGTGGDTFRSKRETMESVAAYVDTNPACYSTGLPRLDDLLGGGLFGGKLYCIAARKKAGKTALLGTISYALNEANERHLFVAMEMTPREIEQRQVARRLHVNPLRLLMGARASSPVSPASIRKAMSETNDATYYEGRPGATLDDIRQLIHRAKTRYGISGVIVDYLQLIGGRSPRDTEELHLRTVAQGLADITRQTGLWILVALQLNQDGNARGGEGPKLACDAYLALHRDKVSDTAWVELEECRYAPYGTLGSANGGGLFLQPYGPYFEEV